MFKKSITVICFMLALGVMSVLAVPELSWAIAPTTSVFSVDFAQPLFDIKKAGLAILTIAVVIFGFGVVKGMVGKR